MKYEPLPPISRDEADHVFRMGDAESIATGLVRLALHEPDWRWVQERCLQLASHPAVAVRRAAAISLGHLARLHGTLDMSSARATLRALASDPDVAGFVDDATDDIARFTGQRVTAA